MSFGIYIHIPYCEQKCTYCDFAKYEVSKTQPLPVYLETLSREIGSRGPQILKSASADVHTVYFGGGTPSLLSAAQVVKILDDIRAVGFKITAQTEITLEINPGGQALSDLDGFLRAGINRFSVGVQTFRDDLLMLTHRNHTADQTKELLRELQKRQLNYSVDVLYSLPGQTLEDLRGDLEIVLGFEPQHVSPYSLTVPQQHPLNKNRAPEETQVEMFHLLLEKLKDAGLFPYEISNFSKPGFESRHNLLYWTDQPYWGVGLSSHSYMKDRPFGRRFWNPYSMEQYLAMDPSSISPQFQETLEKHQSMTDFCHTSLRLTRGLSAQEFEDKFGESLPQLMGEGLKKNIQNQLLEFSPSSHYRLTAKGLLLSNLVFQDFTFLPRVN